MVKADAESRGVVRGDDGVTRCFWSSSELYAKYHDDEWGRPTRDDRWIFEKICLEGFQSGLSWLTILNKRENFRRAFGNFEIDTVARYTSRSVDRLLNDAGIVRHRGKITSTINNAKRAREMRETYGSLASFMWQFEPEAATRPDVFTRKTLGTLSKTPESIALSKELKALGWSFVGPTTAYAFMQAAGIVNDHMDDCDARAACVTARARFRVPRIAS